ncbi:MAG: glycosyltransferase, partial [Thermoanaerobaculia bacterium]
MSVPRVLVAIVSWNSAAHLPAAVKSVPAGVPLVVVDNASKDGSAQAARAAGARVIDAGTNLGFGPACNLAAREGGPSETILFLNPDAALVDGAAALAALLAALDADPALAAAAPRLTGDGQEEFQLRRLPRLGAILREALLVDRLFPGNPGYRRDRYLDESREVPCDVEQPAAAALLVRRAAFEAVGGFDPAFAPAWFEDVDLCAKLHEGGWRIRYVPSARATHVGGVAMDAVPWRDFRPLYVRNQFRYLARHAPVFVRAVARAAMLLGAALRLVLAP